MKNEIVVGLDVGSANIRLAIGQRTVEFADEKMQIIGAISAPAFGVSRGAINSIEDVTSAISACLEKAERLVGVPLESAWVSLNSTKIKCEKSRGVVIVSKSDGEIDESDVLRATEASKSVVVPNNYEIIHAVATKFIIDNQEDIKDPIGMSGMRLEVETLIVLGPTNHIKNLAKAIHRTGLEIEDLAISALVTAEVSLSARQKELGVAVINIGAATTGIAVFEEGNLIHTAVLPLGAEYITSDIAIGLRCGIGLAERIKIEFGNANSEIFAKKDEINLMEMAAEEGEADAPEIISAKYLSEIIEARVEEIFDAVDVELRKIDRSGMLPSGVFLAGGGAALRGIVEVAKRKLRLPVAIAEAKNVNIAIDKARDPGFLTALGLVYWGQNSAAPAKASGIGFAAKSIFGKVRKAFGSIMPNN